MQIKFLSLTLASLLVTPSAFAVDLKEGAPKTGMFMYANTVSIGEDEFTLPVLKTDDLICTTYIADSDNSGEKVKVEFAQYCDPLVEEPIELEDGSKANVITSASASTFYFDSRKGSHRFTESDEEEVLEKVHHVKMSSSVYESFSKGFEDKVEEFILQRDEALAKMEGDKG